MEQTIKFAPFSVLCSNLSTSTLRKVMPMKTLRRKGKNCEYIKIHFNDEVEYKAILDCLNRSSVLIGESFPDDTDGTNFELIKMLESTKMTYDDGKISALIFYDFIEQLFWHCWDLSVLLCKHANLYQPETQNTTEQTMSEEVEPKETPIELEDTIEEAETEPKIEELDKIDEPDIEDILTEELISEESSTKENIDEEVTTISEIDAEPIEEFGNPEDALELEIDEAINDEFDEKELSIEEVPTVDIDLDELETENPEAEVLVEAPVQEQITIEPIEDIVDETIEPTIIEESVVDKRETDEQTVEEPIVEDISADELTDELTDKSTMYEPTIDESFLDGIALEEPPIEEPTIDEPEIEEPVVDEAVVEKAVSNRKKTKTVELKQENAEDLAAEIFAKMRVSDPTEPEKKQTNKFMQRMNKLFKK